MAAHGKQPTKTCEHEHAPMGRRSFFGVVTVAVGAVAALLFALPFVLYLLGPLAGLRGKKNEWLRLGRVGDFPTGQTMLVKFTNPIRLQWDGQSADTGAYVRNLGGGEFLVLAMNCAHLGCPVSWFPQSGLFMCPCHGGVYYENGDRASGPPTRGLFQYVYEVRDGSLWVQAPHLPTMQDTLRHPA